MMSSSPNSRNEDKWESRDQLCPRTLEPLQSCRVFRINLDRWIMAAREIPYVLLPLFFLQFLPYVAAQATNTSPYYNENEPRVKLIVPAMLIMFSMIFSMVACCMFYKFCYVAPATTDNVEPGGRGGWPRRMGRGLDTDVIESFPTFCYSEVKGLKIGKGGVECAVCLNEFEDHETLRLMSPCSHVFHAECIDVWLSSHSTCPVCRANLYPKPGESIPYPFVDSTTNSGTDPEMGNAGRRVLESPDIRLIDSVTWIDQNRPPRSRSTGLSSWRITEMLFPRSHSTGHSLVQLGENLDRFTLQLPEEVRRQLNRTRSHVALPQARSSRRGYRSGSVGSERSGFPYGRQHNRRALSLSFSFSFQTASTRSSPGRGDVTVAPPKGPSRLIKSPFPKTFQGKEDDCGERSFQRLRPDDLV